MFYTISEYKKNGVPDTFISGLHFESDMTKEEFKASVKAYVDQIAPLYSRIESGVDTLVIKFVTKKQAQEFEANCRIKYYRDSLPDGTIIASNQV